MEYERYLDVNELALMIGVSVATVRRWVFDRAIPYHKFGKLVRFSFPEIQEWAKKQTVDPVQKCKDDAGGAE